MGHGAQGLGVTPDIGSAQQQVGCQGQRGGALHAGAHTTGQGQCIHMLHLVVLQQGQRQVGLGWVPGGGPGFKRQIGQMQGKPEHG